MRQLSFATVVRGGTDRCFRAPGASQHLASTGGAGNASHLLPKLFASVFRRAMLTKNSKSCSEATVSFLDIYLVVMALALVGLLVVKFRS
jgi:hypothetical protein